MSGKLAPVKSCRIIGRENEAIGANKGWQRMIFCMYWQCTRFIDGYNIDTFVERKNNELLLIAMTTFGARSLCVSTISYPIFTFYLSFILFTQSTSHRPAFYMSYSILYWFFFNWDRPSKRLKNRFMVHLNACRYYVSENFFCMYMYVAKWQSIAKKYPKVIYHDYCNKIWKWKIAQVCAHLYVRILDLIKWWKEGRHPFEFRFLN